MLDIIDQNLCSMTSVQRLGRSWIPLVRNPWGFESKFYNYFYTYFVFKIFTP